MTQPQCHLKRGRRAPLAAGLYVWMCLSVFAFPADSFEPFKAFSPPQEPESIIKVEALVEPEETRPGETLRLHLRVRLQPGWHIYALKLPEGEQEENLATRIELAGEGLIGPGRWTESEPRIARDGALDRVVPIHEGFAEFDWQGRVAENVQSGTHALAGSITFRACDNRVCTLPRRTDFTARMVVRSE